MENGPRQNTDNADPDNDEGRMSPPPAYSSVIAQQYAHRLAIQAARVAKEEKIKQNLLPHPMLQPREKRKI